MKKSFCRVVVLLSLLTVGLTAGLSGRNATAEDLPFRTLTRVFFQDDDSHTLKWADLRSNGSEYQLTPSAVVSGFPKLDAEQQGLVQMESARGFLLIGVRDQNGGDFGSGWVLIDSGIDEEEHGDHSHWTYPRAPQMRASLIDKQQGNPAHLYCYEQVFYLANDKNNGYTRLDPATIGSTDSADAIQKKAVFYPGGGGHITLAAAGGFGFSSWIDREGDHKGRVDVTPLVSTRPAKIGLTLHLPHGGIHGAAANRGKVFFAPSDGICWLTVPAALPRDASSLTINHISLGKVNDKPVRTGAFQTFGRYVGFTTGAGRDATLTLLDAAAEQPQPISLPLTLADGNRPSGLTFVKPRRGSPLAFVFHDHAAEVDAPNKLSIIELDPNNDGRYDDLKLSSELDVGKSLVEGHGGHHSLSVDADRRRAIFSNPGDGTLSLLSVDERKVIQTFTVKGVPSKVIAIGGRQSSH